MKITGVKINGMERPMGYAFSNVTISWRVEDAVSKRQKSSRVVIAEDAAMTRIVAERSGVLPCAGVTFDIALNPHATYYARVEVTGEDGEHAVSQIVSFDTGKMDEPWTASWIGTREGDGFHPVFEKFFTVEKVPARARLYITGVGLYEASLNGVKIGDDVLAPFFNDYNTAIQCQTYDVTDMLAENSTLSVMLGNGWYKGRLGFDGASAVYGDKFACIAEFHIEYADGTRDVITTDESWQYYPSDITCSDIYDGEGIDRTRNAGGVAKKQAVVLDMGNKKLVDRYSMPLREVEELTVKEVIRTPAGRPCWTLGRISRAMCGSTRTSRRGQKSCSNTGRFCRTAISITTTTARPRRKLPMSQMAGRSGYTLISPTWASAM